MVEKITVTPVEFGQEAVFLRVPPHFESTLEFGGFLGIGYEYIRYDKYVSGLVCSVEGERKLPLFRTG